MILVFFGIHVVGTIVRVMSLRSTAVSVVGAVSALIVVDY